MRKNLIKKLIPVLIAYLIKELDEQAIKEMLDNLLDLAENAVEKSQTEIDDMIFLPLLGAIREGLDIPDND